MGNSILRRPLELRALRYKQTITPEQKARILRWVEALESGRFQQIKDQLRDRIDEKMYGYCCLGVACEVFKAETGRGVWRKDADHDDVPTLFRIGQKPGDEIPELFVENDDVDSYYEASGDLPAAVAQWFGFNDDTNPYFTDGMREMMASTWNDNEGYDFIKIAALVRKTFDLPPQPAEVAARGKLAPWSDHLDKNVFDVADGD